MKKYKLIKAYPGSPKVGTEITVNENGYCCKCTTDVKPENYPYFWEEVIEKDYEILSFQNTSNKVVFNRCPDGTFSSLRSDTGINKGHFVIHSIKRLSDGEVFSIGDSVTGDIANGEITDIVICKNNRSHKYKSNVMIHVTHINSIWLDEIKHKRTSLFTTEDGVDIFEGDEYWFVNKMFELYDAFAQIDTSKITMNKRFSSKEKAEEYILWNRPVLSLQDIDNAGLFSSDIEHFTEIVKSRI